MSIIRSRFVFIIFTCIILIVSLHGQTDQLRLKEDTLKLLSQRIRNATNDSARLALNTLFLQTFNRALLLKGSFEYPFDSLNTIARLLSPDRKLRILNWNLPKDDGTHLYFGFILVNPKEKPKQALFLLTDRSDSISDPGTALLDSHSWYGCLYYRMILSSFNGQDYYTLLGWDAVNPELSQKIIEILTIDPSNGVQFGARIFRNYGNGKECRVFFKYSSSVSMVLTYDRQFLTTEKKWNTKQKKFETDRIESEMIVCDDLVPVAEQFEGRYEFYQPSSETFHGFVFQDGMWTFYQNVDVRNRSK